MKRDEALKTLAEHREELRQRFSVKSLALFGSVVRDEATDASDVDLLVEFDRPVGLLHVIGTEQYLEKLLSVNKVDLVLKRAVLPEFKDGILAEAVNAL
ncbi:MAG: nucleotidyltransferase [Candidatus Methylomirabilota bacterium]|nr:nucleotidyltransferase family protein [Candidatus Methylomirabilis sp.]NJD69877.1 nucleotidyltransferase family protein [candidate division NC10 bacterium]PWB42514.1 MAG: nucleotidyltransferase [candidate division NC10 bacterium]